MRKRTVLDREEDDTESSSPSVTLEGFHQVTLRGLPTVSFQDPAPPFSSNHVCIPPLGAQAVGQEPAFLGPRWGVAAPSCRHFQHSSPRSGAFPALALNVTASHSPHRKGGRKREEGQGSFLVHSESAKQTVQEEGEDQLQLHSLLQKELNSIGPMFASL